MKNLIEHINKAFDHRIRLGIMSALVVNDSMEYKALKELLEVTDGNLASHIKTLEQENYVTVTKRFVGKKPNTTYSVTSDGRSAFDAHLKALEKLIHRTR